MNLENSYWYFRGAIKPEICDRIIAMGKAKCTKLGQVNQKSPKELEELSQEELDDLLKVRNSHVSWLDEPWIFNILRPLINKANEDAGWNFQWDISESAQFTEYKPGQFYDWHPDMATNTYTDGSLAGRYRKLSTTLLLNDPDEFEGGTLEFHHNRDQLTVCEQLDMKGSLVVFPSFVYHKVNPVTSGVRYSLVTWNCGFPFR
jgi:PKHD-type hydroxylase